MVSYTWSSSSFYLRQRRRYMWLPAMSVCLSVSKITQKRAHGFGWNFACRQVLGHGQTDQLLSLIRIIVRIPEVENMKSKVGHAPHSHQATGHGMHCREILFTPRCSTRAREFPQLFLRCMAAKLAQFSDFGLFSNTPVYLLAWPDAAAMRGSRMVFSVTRRNNFVGGKCAPPSALLSDHI